jgi:streptogramin lyase
MDEYVIYRIKNLERKEKSIRMTEDKSTSQEIAAKSAKLAKLEKVNADLREQLANLQTNPTGLPTLVPVSLSLTQPTETAPSPAPSAPTQHSEQETQPNRQAQEFSPAPVSALSVLSGQPKRTTSTPPTQAPSRSGKEGATLDVFISYSHRDKDKQFALQLNDALAQRGYTTWFDENDVFPAGKFWEDIYAGIEEAGAFIFILSPAYIESKPCMRELDYAQTLKKKIICVNFSDKTDIRRIQDKLKSDGQDWVNALNWIDADPFDRMLEKVLEALLTDKDDWRQSGQWLRMATEWNKDRKRNSGLLLHGKELKKAEQWKKRTDEWRRYGIDKRPQPLPIHFEFIHASRYATNRLFAIIIAVIFLFVSLTGGGAYLLFNPDPTLVTTLNNDGQGSLRWSIANAPDGSTITFDQSVRGTIKLTSGELIIKGKLTIDGPGSEVLAVSSGKTNSAILISPGASVTISGLNFQDSSFTGRSFLNNSGTLSLVNSTLSNNHVNMSGGAIDNNGILSVRNSSILANSAFDQFFGGSSYQGGGLGGGIYNTGAGTVTVMNSTISGNSANIGGGIEGRQGTVTIMNSTISGNSAWQTGGGIDTAGPLTLINSTLANNTVGNSYTQNISGGGIYAWYHQTGPVPLLLAFDTIYGNTSSGTGGAIENNADILTIEDSIIAGNNTSYGSDIAGQVPPTILGGQGLVTTGGYNLFQNVAGVSFADPNGIQNTDRMVNTSDLSTIFGSNPQLRDNGGATKTYALLPVSSNPAIGKIPLQYCHIPEILNEQSHQYIDQRGTPRPDGKKQFCDIGAYEADEPPIAQFQSTVTPYPTPTIGPIPLAGNLTEFTIPTNASGPDRITAGPDGNLWFTERNIWANRIGRITPAGTITEFTIPTSACMPGGITAGPDGNLWFTESYFKSNKIGRITPSGTVTEFTIPTNASGPDGITAGPDGNLWFTEDGGNQIGRITPSGTITEFALPTPSRNPGGIAAGPDGNLWFTEESGNQIGRITPSGTITEFAIPTPKSGLLEITAGPDGNLWFTEFWENKIGRITPAGAITEFAIPTSVSHPYGITAGPDGDLWFTEFQGNQIGRITPIGTITEFRMNTPETSPNGISSGPDGNLWFTEELGNKIGRIKIRQLT